MPCFDSDTEYERRKSFKDNLRQMIMHENDLMNHRFTWLCAIQGILFVAFGTLLNSLFTLKKSPNYLLGDENSIKTGFAVSIIILCVIGIVAAYSSQNALFASSNAQRRLVEMAYVPPKFLDNKNNECKQYAPGTLHFREPIIGGCSYDLDVFTWKNPVSEDDKKDLRNFLARINGMDWVRNADFPENKNKASIKIKDNKYNCAILNNERGEVTLKRGKEIMDRFIGVNRVIKFMVKKQNGNLILYKLKNVRENTSTIFIHQLPWKAIPRVFMFVWATILISSFVYILLIRGIIR